MHVVRGGGGLKNRARVKSLPDSPARRKRIAFKPTRPITNRPQIANLPYTKWSRVTEIALVLW
jgi:hypothetical protein